MHSKGVLFNIQRFSINDGPGIRTTVFLKGCPLACQWCHNPEGRSSCINNINGKEDGFEMTAQKLFEIILQDSIFYEESGGGATFSGGEPFLQADFLFDVLELCHNNKIPAAIDTTGYSDQILLKKVLGFEPVFLYDLKLINPTMHKQYTGVDNAVILNNLEFLVKRKASVIIRIPLIPGITASVKNIQESISFLLSIGFKGMVNLLPYHQTGAHKHHKYGLEYAFEGLKNMQTKDAEPFLEMFINNGFRATIGG